MAKTEQQIINDTLFKECLKEPPLDKLGLPVRLATEINRLVSDSQVVWNMFKSKRKAYVAARKAVGGSY